LLVKNWKTKLIVRVAIKKDDIIFIGELNQRHSHLLCNSLLPFGYLKYGIHGFVDEYHNFYNREEANKHAFDCGQIDKPGNCLISEELW
jgi:hypothetical protein